MPRLRKKKDASTVAARSSERIEGAIKVTTETTVVDEFGQTWEQSMLDEIQRYIAYHEARIQELTQAQAEREQRANSKKIFRTNFHADDIDTDHASSRSPSPDLEAALAAAKYAEEERLAAERYAEEEQRMADLEIWKRIRSGQLSLYDCTLEQLNAHSRALTRMGPTMARPPLPPHLEDTRRRATYASLFQQWEEL